jgi:hypothetical protein
MVGLVPNDVSGYGDKGRQESELNHSTVPTCREGGVEILRQAGFGPQAPDFCHLINKMSLWIQLSRGRRRTLVSRLPYLPPWQQLLVTSRPTTNDAIH